MQGNAGVYRTLGAFLLFVSFMSFNASSVSVWQRIPLVGLIASNTIISSAFGVFTVMGWKLAVRNFQMDIMHCLDGMLAGLVAITAGAPRYLAAAVHAGQRVHSADTLDFTAEA